MLTLDALHKKHRKNTLFSTGQNHFYMLRYFSARISETVHQSQSKTATIPGNIAMNFQTTI
jgi:anthranilate/para-aminobenzoate synthase component II